MKTYVKALLEQMQLRGSARTAVFLDGSHAGERLLWTGQQIIWSDPRMQPVWTDFLNQLNETPAGEILAVGGAYIFAEHLVSAPRLVILGGGHVSLAVSQIGKILGFYVTVADERPEYADPGRFQAADEVICGSYEEVLAGIPEYDNTYYVIVTPGHVKDELCAELLFRREYAYLGMIGSKAKVAKTRLNLRDKGVSEARLNTMHAPVGLPIGGETPGEIAVSIAAEIVQVKNQTRSSELPQELQAAAASVQGPAILAVIAEKSGSSPRGVGSRMLVGPDGLISGTIGGGAVEFAAVGECLKMLDEGRHFASVQYDLSDSAASTLGMICGGQVRVLFERI